MKHVFLFMNAVIFRQLPELKQRIAGKSLPFEKFAVAKAKRYLDQNEYLTLAAIVSNLRLSYCDSNVFAFQLSYGCVLFLYLCLASFYSSISFAFSAICNLFVLLNIKSWNTFNNFIQHYMSKEILHHSKSMQHYPAWK